ncbi:hypothetical protein F5Y16DRAFT_380989 [Xylariaceae sp. FL0255]|nr:hypothetical protein F5Y16DRAFT_380989 [Xylariaceae sp. FL0255]
MSSMTPSDADITPLIYGLAVVFSILPIVAVGCRFHIRLRSARLGLEDWTILVSLIGCIVTAILLVIGAAVGRLGRPLDRDAQGQPVYDYGFFIVEKIDYGIDLSQMFALGPTKISVLLLYRRIFGVDGRRFNIISMSLIMLTFAWTIIFFVANALQYINPADSWTKPPSEAPTRWDNITLVFLAQSYADVALDVLIIALPVPLVFKLQMTLKRKLQISVVFLLGALTTAASVTRTAIQYGVAREYESGNPDSTYFLAPIDYWPLIEASLGIVAASLPLLRPIGQMSSMRNMFVASGKAFSSIFSTSTQRSQKSGRSFNDSESGGTARRANHSKDGEKWFEPYDISVLHPTIVDNETHVEALPQSDFKSDKEGGITRERGYDVSFQDGRSSV